MLSIPVSMSISPDKIVMYIDSGRPGPAHENISEIIIPCKSTFHFVVMPDGFDVGAEMELTADAAVDLADALMRDAREH